MNRSLAFSILGFEFQFQNPGFISACLVTLIITILGSLDFCRRPFEIVSGDAWLVVFFHQCTLCHSYRKHNRYSVALFISGLSHKPNPRLLLV
jgi:hypothetical protein